MAKRKNRYQQLQKKYFAKKNKQVPEDFSKYTTQITANSYILVNPVYTVDIVWALLSVHNKITTSMIIMGKPEDFQDHPNQIYKVINETKTLELKRRNDNA